MIKTLFLVPLAVLLTQAPLRSSDFRHHYERQVQLEEQQFRRELQRHLDTCRREEQRIRREHQVRLRQIQEMTRRRP
jgi:hypothetical protein